MVHIMIDYDHKFDDDVVEFFNTIEHLGGGCTVNFIRGPMYHGQSRGGKRNVENAAINLGGGEHQKQRATKGKQGILQEVVF